MDLKVAFFEKHTLELMDELYKGNQVDETEIYSFCDFIDTREDCSDFRLTAVLRMIFQFNQLLSQDVLERIKKTVLNFRYFMTEPGNDNMCFWSENHQILFAQCEYLAGQLYPEELFSNSQKLGKEKMESSRKRILHWLQTRFETGFIEWHSHVYYAEDIAALINLVDFCLDEELVMKSKMVLDLIFFDLASHSYKGILGCTHGRSYEKQKKAGKYADIAPICCHAFGYDYAEFNLTKIHSLFKYVLNYQVPEVIKAIAFDDETVVIKDSFGFDLKDIHNEINIKERLNQFILWQMEAFTNPESIEYTIDMINEYHMLTNDFLGGFKAISHPLLRKFRLLPLISKVLNPVTNGIAIQRANCYTYKTRDYSLSTAMSHQVGECGDQQHIWQVTLAPHLNVFTTHPTEIYTGDNPYLSLSPNYWVGNGRMPHAVQDQNIHLTIYSLPRKKTFMEKSLMHYTHAYFPRELFDEVVLEGHRIFGRYNDTYLALIGKNKLAFKNECDLIQEGQLTFWICEVSSHEYDETFLSFIERIKSNTVGFQNKTLTYISQQKEYKLLYKKSFQINHKEVNTNYDLFDTPYLKVKRHSKEMRIEFQNKRLTLNIEKMIREERECNEQ